MLCSADLSIPPGGEPFGSLAEALGWLASRIDYERTRWMAPAERSFHLDRMGRLLALVGHPERQFPAVHVAGTKGKGSTSAMIAAMLEAAGYRTGLFTSPHLEQLQERIRINGQMPTDAQMLGLLNAVWPAVCQMDRQTGQQVVSATGQPLFPGAPTPAGGFLPPVASETGFPVLPATGPSIASSAGPTYFEILTALGMLHFAWEKVQMAVLEVGLGGRLDATNLCQPVVSVITSISFDHTQLLGNTLEAIATEKAGIIKPGVPVVSGVTQPGPREVIRQVCQTQQAPWIELGKDFGYSYRPPRNLPRSGQRGRMDFHYQGPGGPWRLEEVELNLLGRHQAANAAGALATIALLRQAGWEIPDAACREGLATVRWPARCELLPAAPGRPAVLLDTAHNVASVQALLDVLEESFVVGRRLLVFATTEDKDVPGMLARLLPAFDQVVLTQYLNNPRRMPVEQLVQLARQIGGREYPSASSPAEAWEMAHRLAQPEDLLCITGSFFLIGEILPVLRVSGYLDGKKSSVS
jgi:dihydrofolate synthase/folylpolyglutamate synthase